MPPIAIISILGFLAILGVIAYRFAFSKRPDEQETTFNLSSQTGVDQNSPATEPAPASISLRTDRASHFFFLRRSGRECFFEAAGSV